MPSQYALELPLAPSFSAANFFISDCNHEAHDQVMAWPHWPGPALLLCGAPGSGKSHLARLWRERTAAIVAGNMSDALAIEAHHLLIENIDTLPDEEPLLHVINTVKEQGQSLLLTARVFPRQLPFTLPDLTSRLLAMPLAVIGAPDDALLASVLRKQFADRQMKVEEDVIAYIAARMERSMGAAQALVLRLDQAAIAEHKPLTVPFVRRIMAV